MSKRLDTITRRAFAISFLWSSYCCWTMALLVKKESERFADSNVLSIRSARERDDFRREPNMRLVVLAGLSGKNVQDDDWRRGKISLLVSQIFRRFLKRVALPWMLGQDGIEIISKPLAGICFPPLSHECFRAATVVSA